MKTRLLIICAILGLFPLTSALSAEEGRSAGLARQVLSQLTDDGAFSNKLVQAALKRTFSVVRYVPAYVSIPYPNGDVPETTGVCTDEIIRVYRAVGVDLQQSVHEDMKANFREYPSAWGLSHTDTNIDHRRVPNLQKFFERMKASLKISKNPSDYKPGDLITSLVPPNLPHIAIVVPAPDGSARPWIVHNIGEGPQLEDRLFEFSITGHYRWHPR